VVTKQKKASSTLVIHERLHVLDLQFLRLAYMIFLSSRSLRLRAVLTGLLALETADSYLAPTLGNSKLCLSLLH